jgi:biopolymer transport protein ExbB
VAVELVISAVFAFVGRSFASVIKQISMNETNFIKTFQAGGLVMWPLLLFSIVVVALSIERGLFWWKNISRQKNFAQRFFLRYRQYSQLQPQDLERERDLPLARIFMAAIGLPQPTTEEFRLALETESQAELPSLNRFSGVFDSVITLSPLLGLLGTVIGLMNSFAALGVGGANASNTNSISAGIGEALTATATGLIVAILASIASSFFRGCYQRQLIFMQEYCGQIELIYRSHYSQKINQQTNSATHLSNPGALI